MRHLIPSTERSEGRAHLGREEPGLLPRGEVAAFVDLVVIDQFRIRPLRQLRGASYCSPGKTVTATGIETPLALKKPPLYSQ